MRKVKIIEEEIRDENDVRIRCKNNLSWTCKTNCAAYYEKDDQTGRCYACCRDLPIKEGTLFSQAIGEMVEGE